MNRYSKDVDEYYDEEYESEEPSMTENTVEEEEYLDFLEKYGAIDFSCLMFLPKIRTVSELEEQKKVKLLMSHKV